MADRLHGGVHPLKRLALIIAIASGLFGLAPAAAPAAFGFEEVDVALTEIDGSPATQAGSHPFAMTTTLRVDTTTNAGLEAPDGDLKDLRIAYPPGLVTAPAAVPACSTADFLEIEGDENACPDSSAVGVGEITASTSGPIPAGSQNFLHTVPVYSLTPPPAAVARIGFVVEGLPVTVALGLGNAQPFAGVASLSDLTQAALFYSARLSIWGVPANSAHDSDRGHCVFSAGSCPADVSEAPFLTLPRSCTGPLQTTFEADSWQDPGQWVSATAVTHDNAKPPDPLGLSGCGKIGFDPKFEARPTTELAETPSGLDLGIDAFDEGLANPNGIAQSDIKDVSLALEGMSVNPAFAKATVACTPAQYAQEAIDSEPGQGCPPGSQIGTVEMETPLREGEILEGGVFAGEGDNPLPLYVVIRDPQLGILIKQAGQVSSAGGQAIATFEGLPQLPISHFGLHLQDGDAGPLLSPPECGEFVTETTLTPWSEPGSPLTATASFEIAAGPGGGPCPSEETLPALPGTSAPPSPAPRVVVMPNSLRKPRCAKGKRHVVKHGKARCIAKHCLPAAVKGRARRCIRPRERDGARTRMRSGG